MWISKKELDRLYKRLEVLESHASIIQVPTTLSPSSVVFASSGSWYDHHVGLDVPTVVVALAQEAGLRWNPGEPGKIVSGKRKPANG